MIDAARVVKFRREAFQMERYRIVTLNQFLLAKLAQFTHAFVAAKQGVLTRRLLTAELGALLFVHHPPPANTLLHHGLLSILVSATGG
jgi:hypothetical protein